MQLRFRVWFPAVELLQQAVQTVQVPMSPEPLCSMNITLLFQNAQMVFGHLVQTK